MLGPGHTPAPPRLLLAPGPFDNMDEHGEGSHSGRVRAPAKRLTRESGFMGSNPIPSASQISYLSCQTRCCCTHASNWSVSSVALEAN